MTTKKCFKCGIEKGLSEFYKHKAMGDGHLGKCKECAKNDVRLKYVQNIENPEYIEKERERGREKYERLNYKERTQYKKSYSRKTRSIQKYFKNLDIDLQGKELHHWNYNLKHDVFILSKRAHKLIHKYLTIDLETECFVNENQLLLNTKALHFKFIKRIFEENNVNYEIEVYPLNI